MNPVAVNEIESAEWSLRLGAAGQVVLDADDIRQCIAIILKTPKGSVPHRPDFGSDAWRYLDWPVDEARPHLVREVIGAVERWEPRVLIESVQVLAEGEHLKVLVSVRRRDGGETLVVTT